MMWPAGVSKCTGCWWFAIWRRKNIESNPWLACLNTRVKECDAPFYNRVFRANDLPVFDNPATRCKLRCYKSRRGECFSANLERKLHA